MTTQHLLLFVFFATLAVSALSESAVVRQNDLIIGKRVEGDTLLHRSFIKKDASWLGKIVTFTKTFTGDGVSSITQVRALDQHENGHGASAKIIAGGVDYVYVTLRIESERYRQIDYVVEIYGKKLSTQ